MRSERLVTVVVSDDNGTDDVDRPRWIPRPATGSCQFEHIRAAQLLVGRLALQYLAS